MMNLVIEKKHLLTPGFLVKWALTAAAIGAIFSGCRPVPTPAKTQVAATSVPLSTSRPKRSLTPTPIKTKTVTLTPTATVPAALQVQPEDLKGVQIEFWHPWSGNTAAQVDSIVNEFNQVNVWGIQVKASGAGSSLMLNEEVKSNLVGGQLADVVAAPIDQLTSWQSAAQVITPLNDYLNSPQWGMQPQEISDIVPLFLEQDRFEGDQLAIPALRDGQILFYNLTWAAEMGFSAPPTSPEQFKAQSCAALQANVRTQRIDKIGTGGWVIETTPLALLSWMQVFGGQPVPADDSKPYSFNSTPVQDSINFLLDMFQKTCIWPKRLPNSYQYFTDRMALFYSGSVSDIPFQARLQEYLKSKDQWTVIPYPSDNSKPVFIVNGPSYAILHSNPRQQLAAWLFIRWLALPRNQVKLVESTGLLPVNLSSTELLKVYSFSNPQWQAAVNLIPLASPAPNLPSWTIASEVLQDAGWQIFHQAPTPIPVPTILQQLDDTIPQLINYSPTLTPQK
ncbi:MAG: extracellular solute-binding protein [Anaerolineaceae bacterium]